MSEESPRTNTPKERDTGAGGLWLLCAFVPAIFFLLFQKGGRPGLLPVIFIIDAVCSIAGAIGIMRNETKDQGFKYVLIVCLAVFFFVLNIVIAVFIGCASMGRIAP